MKETKKKLDETLNTVLAGRKDRLREDLIPILQDVQEKIGYLPKEAISRISGHLNLPESKIYGVATFYNQFKFSPPGRYHIMVCRGTACHVKGSSLVLEALQRELKVEPGRTTRDGLFSIEVVACMGACGLAPVVSVNGELHAKLAAKDVPNLIASYRQKADEEDGNNKGASSK